MSLHLIKRIKEHFSRRFELRDYQKRNSALASKKLSLISNDCCAGVLYHQMGRKFLSPTINLYFENLDYVLFCKHIKEFLLADLIFDFEQTDVSKHVVGKLTINSNYSVRIHFLHYDSFDIAKKKWNERRKRVNFDNLLFIYNLTNNKDESACIKRIKEFNSQVEGKTLFLVRSHIDEKDAVYIDFGSAPFSYAQVVQPVGQGFDKYIDQLFSKNVL